MSRVRTWLTSPWLGLALAIVVAILLRFPLLDSIPPGLSFDEAGDGVAALDVAQGAGRVWWFIGGGKEPLMAYLVLPLFWLFGQTSLALHLYTACLGLLAVPAVFWLAREMFGDQISESPSSWDGQAAPNCRFCRQLPVFAALGLATAFWHVAFSRVAFRALALPAIEALALAWLWHTLRRAERDDTHARCNRSIRYWLNFAGVGVLIGLSLYSYTAARFLPVALVVFLLAEALLAWRRRFRPLLLELWPGWLLLLVTTLVVFSPLAAFFLTFPAAFVERAETVSVFNPAWNQGDPLGTQMRTIYVTLGTWTGLTGDPNLMGNLPGRPMLGLPMAVFFWLGVAVCVWQVVRWALARRARNDLPSPSPLPLVYEGFVPRVCLFLLCGWSVMLLPAVLSPEGAPHHLRAMGTAPFTYVLAAVGIVQLAYLLVRLLTRLRKRFSPTRRLAVCWLVESLLLPVLIFVPVGLVTARTYFYDWARQPELYMAFDVYAVELADLITASNQSGSVYVIPMDLRAAQEARHYTLDFLFHNHPPFYYLVVDESTLALKLTQAADGNDELRVVWWTRDKHAAADEKELVAFLLAANGQRLGEETYPAYRIETWRLPSAHTVFRLPAIDDPVGIDFDGKLRLEAAYVAAGEGQVQVALRWLPLAAMDADYKVSLRLISAEENTVVQKDRFLRHNWHQGTSLWPSEPVNEYYLLAPVPPGDYRVQLVVYHPDTLAPLVAGGQAEVTLGSVTVE